MYQTLIVFLFFFFLIKCLEFFFLRRGWDIFSPPPSLHPACGAKSTFWRMFQGFKKWYCSACYPLVWPNWATIFNQNKKLMGTKSSIVRGSNLLLSHSDEQNLLNDLHCRMQNRHLKKIVALTFFYFKNVIWYFLSFWGGIFFFGSLYTNFKSCVICCVYSEIWQSQIWTPITVDCISVMLPAAVILYKYHKC